MKTNWQTLYILWSVLVLGLGCAADTRAPQFARRKKTFKLSAPKSDLINLPTTSSRTSSRSFPNFPLPPRSVRTGKPKAKLQSGFAHLPDVSVTCSVSDFVVRVKPSFYGLGADADELRLGSSCASNGVLRPSGDLLFTYPLTACDAVRELPHDYLVYKFVLHYESSLKRFPGLTRRLSVNIECRYPRDHHVYQLAVKPTWHTAVLRKRLKGRPSDFQIALMDDSWSEPAKSQVYQLGQMVNFQISASHLPKKGKLYISSCYAAPSSDAKSFLKYTIIDNMGCMMDGKLDPGASRFVSRTDKTLRFSLRAFQFTADPDIEIKIHCKLSISSEGPDLAHKSCTYKGNRWVALAGGDSICECCDSHCVTSKRRRAALEGSVSIGLLVSDQSYVTDVSTSTDHETAMGHYTELHGWENLREPTDKYDGGKKRGFEEAEGNLVSPGETTESDFDFSRGVLLEEWDATGVHTNEFGEDGPGDKVGDLVESEALKGREEQGINQNHSGEVVHLWAQLAPHNSKEQEANREYAVSGEVDESRGASEGEWRSDADDDDLADDGEKTWYFTWR